MPCLSDTATVHANPLIIDQNDPRTPLESRTPSPSSSPVTSSVTSSVTSAIEPLFNNVMDSVADDLQEEMCASAARLLRRAGYTATLGSFADLTDVRVQLSDGKRLRVVPMAETVWGDLEHPDLDVWHVMAMDVNGAALQYPVEHPDFGRYNACPSVLWSERVGLDPAVALTLVNACLADADLRRTFALGR